MLKGIAKNFGIQTDFSKFPVAWKRALLWNRQPTPTELPFANLLNKKVNKCWKTLQKIAVVSQAYLWIWEIGGEKKALQ